MGNIKKKSIDDVKNFIRDLGGICISDKYVSVKSNLSLICPICNEAFYRNFDNIQNRKNIKCSKCSIGIGAKQLAYSFEYIKSFIESNSNCKLISKEYTNVDEKLELKCKCGNIFYASFYKFDKYNKRQCNKCGLKILKEKNLTKLEEIINTVELEGYKFMKNDTSKGGDQMVLLQCNKLHSPYWVRFAKFKSKSSNRRCPHCYRSIGEEAVEKELQKHNVEYKKEYKFDGLVGLGGLPLRYDFSILENDKVKFLIEYDGKQHFEVAFNDELEFKKILTHDKMKNDYATNNNIPLFRISYKEYENIPKIINNILNEKNVV